LYLATMIVLANRMVTTWQLGKYVLATLDTDALVMA